jgi:hypothetical protein
MGNFKMNKSEVQGVGKYSEPSGAKYTNNSVKVSNGRSGEVPTPAKGWFKKAFRGVKKLGGKILRGKGIFGAINPLGRLASNAGLFGGRGRRGGGRPGGMMGMMGGGMMGMRGRGMMQAMMRRRRAMAGARGDMAAGGGAPQAIQNPSALMYNKKQNK